MEVIEPLSGVCKKVCSILFSAFYRVSFLFDLVFKEAIAISRVNYFFDFPFLIGILFLILFVLD